MLTRLLRNTLLLSIIATSLPACADSASLGGSLPSTYKSECGSCHTPFPAKGLTASDWRQVMKTLDKHYGDNASLDPATRKELERYLVTNASNGGASTGGSEVARLTKSAWFTRKHHELGSATWQDPRIKSAANCSACHPRANDGRYNEHEIKMPAGMKWEDE